MAVIDKWDKRFMGLAHEVARWSKDPSSKVGAICVSSNRRQYVAGFNGFPVGVEDDTEKLMDKETKNKLMVHAELNCIINATVLLEGWTMYVTKPPCCDCALAILNARIARLVCPPLKSGSSWFDSQLFALSVLRSNVEVDFL